MSEVLMQVEVVISPVIDYPSEETGEITKRVYVGLYKPVLDRMAIREDWFKQIVNQIRNSYGDDTIDVMLVERRVEAHL